MISKLLPLVPPHDVYVEPFAGSAKLFFAKSPSDIEVLNDANAMIANLFYCVAHHFDEFYQKVSPLVYSRRLFEMFRRDIFSVREVQIPDVTLASKFYYYLNTVFSGIINNNTFSVSKKQRTAHAFFSKLNALPAIHARLKNTIIEHADFEEVIRRYDSPNTFFYIDPPYLGTEYYYDVGFSYKDHVRLLDLLTNLRGKWLLSSYSNELYDERLKCYNRLEFDVAKHACHNPNSKKGGARSRGREIVWFNYELGLSSRSNHLTLYDDVRTS